MSLRLRGCVGLGIAAGTLACARPDFEVSDLPSEPIAFVYRTVQENERLIDDAEQDQKQAVAQHDDSLEVKIDASQLQHVTGLRTADDSLRDRLGHVSLYIAPDKRLEGVSFAGRGSWPLEWSADHERLLYTGFARGAYQLFEWVAASGEVRQLTSGAFAHNDGCYGPDGALAAVRIEPAAKGSTTRIWVQRRGEAPRPVTPGPADAQPSWSPDGTRLVYAAQDPNEGSVLRWVDPGTGQEGTLGRGRAPAFSPDGQWIVFSAPTPEGWKLWRMRPDGSAKRGFGRSAFQENDPCVSPDGRFVVFTGTMKGSGASPISHLLVRPIDGSVDRHLELSGSGLLPVW